MANVDGSWVRPYWLERQGEPASPEFVPGTVDGGVGNVTHRSGVLIGNVATYERSFVDPRGLLTPFDGGWSLDWWIGAEDRWHLPSRTMAVRQRLVDGTPVVETAMRVPGGDALHRAYAMQSTELGPCAVIELDNRTAVPYAVAIAVRPFNVLGPARVDAVELDGATVVVNGTDAIHFSKAPAHARFSDGVRGDVAVAVFAGAEGEGDGDRDGGAHRVVDADGLASAAFVFPLPHTAILRAVVPLRRADGRARRARGGARATARATTSFPDAVPTAAQVASGWQRQEARGLRLQVPDQRLQDAIDTARCHLLLAHGGEDLVTWPAAPFDFAAAATVLAALGAHGFHDEVAQVLATWPERQTLDGAFVGAPERFDANGAALLAVGEHWRLSRDDELVERLVGPLAKGAHWIEKKRTSRRGARAAGADGLLPAGEGRGDAPATALVTSLLDAATSVLGLRRVAAALDAAGQPEVAEDARTFATRLREGLDASLGRAGARGPRAEVAALSVVEPWGPLAADHPFAAAVLDHARDDVLDRAVVARAGATGVRPDLTMLLAAIEIDAGDERALDRLAWIVEHAGATTSWPTAIHPNTGGGAAGRPHDPDVTARFLLAVRRLLVRERPGGGGLALVSLLPSTWLGQSIDVRDAPTAYGSCSYAVRWHGDRPALLWEIEPHEGIDSVALTAPGLDPAWAASSLKGEALLGAIAPPVLGGSFA